MSAAADALDPLVLWRHPAFRRTLGVGSLLAVKLGLALAAGLVIARMGRLALLGVASRLMSLVVVYNAGLLAYVLSG